MWQTLVNGIASILKYLYELTVNIGIPSYALAIILLTLGIKIVLYPLSYKQMHSMKRMQEIQPKVAEIQAKYKKTPEKANQAIMELYKQEKVNPMSGCLPLLVQMPILIALFQALQGFQYQDLGSSFFWVQHLKYPDPIILPVIVAATTYLQSKVTTPTSTGNQNNPAASTTKMMLYFMPLMIGYMSTKFPAGLSLYWIFFNLFGTLQQVIINRQPVMQKGEIGGK